MKKALTIAFLFILIQHKAQDSLGHSKKTSLIGVGFGIPNAGKTMLRRDIQNQLLFLERLGVNNTSSITYTATGIGPFSLKIEHQFGPRFSFGPVFTYAYAAIQYQYKPPNNTNNGLYLMSTNYNVIEYNLQSFSAGLRGVALLNKNQSYDLYLMLAAGYTAVIESYSDNYIQNNYLKPHRISNPFINKGPEFLINPYHPFYWGITIGIRDYLTPSIGVFVEAGCDKWAFLQFGLFFRSR